MKFSTKVYVPIVAALFVLGSVSFVKTSFDCEHLHPSFCGLTENAILVIGGSMLLWDQALNRILPGTEVEIEDDAGKVRLGKLTYIATKGRRVERGDKVRLDCANADPSSVGKSCELTFYRLDPSILCSQGIPCKKNVQSWSIGLDKEGTPDARLLNYVE